MWRPTGPISVLVKSDGVSVALPVYRAAGTLERAVECITRQTIADLDVVMVLNGSDQATTELAHALARREPRVRVLDLPEANLAAALNTALEAARFPLVARMDADDTCPPQRLAAQAAFLSAHPSLGGVGCAWELAEPDGKVITVVRPPCDPARLRWRLLLGNVLAHGSMMLRRDAVLRAGGYDTTCARAQDYDLWLRLPGQLACLPEVLYRHVARFPDDPGRSTREQAEVAAVRMVAAWRALPSGAEGTEAAVAASLGRSGGSDAPALPLGSEPSREGLLAWLWLQWNAPPAPRRVAETCRRARVREVGRRLRAEGVTALWLWGAGDHTRRLLETPRDLGLPVIGLIDDQLAGQHRFGFGIAAPAHLRPGDHALVSSDWHEDAIWVGSAPHRERGVRVHRLYEGD